MSFYSFGVEESSRKIKTNPDNTGFFIIFANMKRLVLILLFMSSLSNAQTPCGKWRWEVKTLSDELASTVNLRDTIDISISELSKLDTSELTNRRNWEQYTRQDDERTLYRIIGILDRWKEEPDLDFHLCIKSLDGQDSIVCEIPSPECPQSIETKQDKYYLKSRSIIESIPLIKPIKSWKIPLKTVKIEVVGVSFHDLKHTVRGRMPNNLELHPVVKVIIK